jgi:hypothetical protein
MSSSGVFEIASLPTPGIAAIEDLTTLGNDRQKTQGAL